MQANQTTLQPIIEGARQYVIPLFQRPYSWGRKEWELLWKDLVELSEMERPRSHFLGSIVTMQTNSVPEGVPKYLLIDGQQRLTTIFILLAVIRDRAREEGEPELAEEINNTLLINPYHKKLDRFKLLPTRADRDAFHAIIYQERPISEGLMAQAYGYFAKRLPTGADAIRGMKKVVAGSLSVVSIVLGTDDNPYLVFESLNAKGLPLSQSDLIRNFFFMRIHADSHDDVYADYWKPMQDRLGEGLQLKVGEKLMKELSDQTQLKLDAVMQAKLGANLTEFFRHFLMKGGSIVRHDDIYLTMKERVGQGDAVEYLEELSRFSVYYAKFLNPRSEVKEAIREALERLQKLDVTTAFPFLLNCFEEQQAGRLNDHELSEILKIVENYVIRRFVCGMPTNQLKNIFPPLFGQSQAAGHGDLVAGLKVLLQAKGYPKDEEFQLRFADVKLYGGDRAKRGKLILDRLESQNEHLEPVDFGETTVEHIMPQTLTEDWQSDLGPEWEMTHELLLHTLGNLTLTGYNPTLSNEPFTKKKETFSNSHIVLNKYFKNIQIWNHEAIESRASHLADLALNVWPYFGDDQAALATPKPGAAPVSLKLLGNIYPVESWRDVIEKTLNSLAESEPEKFDRVIGSFKRFVRGDNIGMHSWRQLSNGMFVNVNLSSKDVKRFCNQILDAVELTAEDWHVETA